MKTTCVNPFTLVPLQIGSFWTQDALLSHVGNHPLPFIPESGLGIRPSVAACGSLDLPKMPLIEIHIICKDSQRKVQPAAIIPYLAADETVDERDPSVKNYTPSLFNGSPAHVQVIGRPGFDEDLMNAVTVISNVLKP
ncbi:hypothetical protein BHE90_012141 [Fusarium euwallaceae]|uniref:Amidase domain-containing protein n=1 Tax=Fusarium euwallaceae TaxID=1147111 RepID=A0A430LCM8_9HYPO|nr:hypothetical protein BHE90_012141 [Fusarium euwallaceae]